MKDLFQKALVVCAAISAFFGGAYTLGSSAKSQWSSAIQSEISAYNQALQDADASPADASKPSTSTAPASKPKSKFGFTYEQ